MDAQRPQNIIVQNPDSRTKHLLSSVGQRKPYWLFIEVGQDGTPNQTTLTNSKSTDHELVIRGAITDRTNTKIRITDQNSGFSWSADPLPILSMAGKNSNAVPVLQWFTPYLLSPRSQLKFEFFNDATMPDAAGGWIVLLCEY